ncbi:phytoene desaturase family protein [Aestuariirhabdus litorea]|uniref:NAD(P)/FAD-dependent oxidoreductase n=1 Tax=Aestuariirhabdus litorea TaxID=2528527 RepID=A0A3P3VS66_9GAMM|nr:NAD(P)/FAD-dependent oxidoreductase [Aestuariirhabdus litorea]RRJ83643.1 NAD(P)/FAD-dependent oxidoreductase [Aestuariirhabdus litorea]RWW96864.1 FAD-binding protein [Endozoicomonadaceae bacterium GTF-13]
MTEAQAQGNPLRIGRRYRRGRVEGHFDAIIIGSGPAGLAAGVCLSKSGQRVLVLEQHYTAGGFSHSYSRKGYEWDVGVHYIGDVGHRGTVASRLCDYLSDRQLRWAYMGDNYDRFLMGSERFDLRAGEKAFREGLVERFPEEAMAIDRYLELIRRVSKAMPGFSLDKLLPRWAVSLRRLIWPLPDCFNRPTYQVLRDLTANEKLIAVLCGQYGDNGLPPKKSSFLIHALIARHYLNGGYYPVGGASQIAASLLKPIRAAGGELFTYARVEQILVEGGRAVGVRMVDGLEIRSPRVISTVGVFNTFNRLLPDSAARAGGYREKLHGVRPAMAHVGVYIGIRESSSSLGLERTNLWIYPDEFHDANLDNFCQDMRRPFPAVYISFPSAKDPSWEQRYPGRATIEMVAPAPWKWFAPWQDKPWGKRGEDYEALKAQLGRRLLEVLYEQLPQLRGKIDYYEVSTPLSTAHFAGYSQGEIYGIDHDPARFEQQWLRPKTRIKGLYLSGQDTLTCGFMGALASGVISAIAVLGWRAHGVLRGLARRQPRRVPEQATASPSATMRETG